MLTIKGKSDLPQILFIHGGGVASWMWDDVLPFLEEHYQCILVDLPYHGNHESYDDIFTIESYAPKIFQMLEPLRNSQPIAVVGFSIGAQIALELMSLKPQYFTFAMINSALCKPIVLPTTILELSIKLSMPLTRLKSFAKLQAKPLYIPAHLFEKYFKQSQAITSSQLIEILKTNMSYKSKENLQHCLTSTLITYGEQEKKAIIDSADELASMLPNSEVYMISRLGHGYPFAFPKLFAKAILSRFPH